MKLMHLGDLHFGKKVNEFSMLEDQKYIVNAILRIVEQEQTDGVILAGDIYDKKDPSAEAVSLFDDFLVRLVKKSQKVFIISGNHDSAERIAFGGRLFEANEVYISPVYDGLVKPVVLTDAYGELNVYLMPFVKPVHVKHFYEEEEINDYTDAIRVAIDHMQVDTSKRNLLVMHQFVTGAERSESEEISVGGLDDVNADILEPFDYVALGHIHGPQKIGRETIRYSGSPLKYSFSEIGHKKSAVIIELEEKGNTTIKLEPLVPARDMYELRGTYEELTARDYYEGKPFQDGYLNVILTDEEDVPEALGRLRTIYPNIMKLSYDNTRTRHNEVIGGAVRIEEKNPYTLFSELFEKQNGKEMSEQQAAYLKEKIESIWGGEA